ncbi:hypothetical protein KASHIRA_02580 [Serratia phage vB_SmaM-Kashira]|nr:hypothetical protein KASHIRA_02580 [Serratia phage vB_SmaM-Kashira]
MWYVTLTSLLFHALVLVFIVWPVIRETSRAIALCASIYRWTMAGREANGLPKYRWKVFKYSCGWFWNFFGSEITRVSSNHGEWFGIGDWKVYTGEKDESAAEDRM